MKNKEVDLHDRYVKFLEDRRGEGEDYAVQIMKVLRENRRWVRARDLKHLNICPEATLFRLLKGLTENQIIENKTSPNNRNVSSYRLSPNFPDFYFLTDKEMREEHSRLKEKNKILSENLQAAHTVIFRNKLVDEYETEKKNFWKTT